MTTRGVDAFDEQQGRHRVPSVVLPDVAQVRLAQDRLPRTPVRLAFDRPAVRLGEDEVVVLPQRAGGNAFLELGGAMRPERLHQRRGEGHGSAAPSAFGSS
jgi:hypothetical protein